VHRLILTNIYIVFVTSTFTFRALAYYPNILIHALDSLRATSVALLIVL